MMQQLIVFLELVTQLVNTYEFNSDGYDSEDKTIFDSLDVIAINSRSR